MKEYLKFEQSVDYAESYEKCWCLWFSEDSSHRRFHREETCKPAIIWSDGLVMYCKQGKTVGTGLIRQSNFRK